MRKMRTASVLMAIALAASTAIAQGFHFTVTADPRENHAKFDDTLADINTRLGGPGAFHVSVGDVDRTIGENRAKIDARFCNDYPWYTIVGNHEQETGADMQWLRAEYDTGNGVRTALSDPSRSNADGPVGSQRVMYTWDYGNAHFITLNEYWDGGTSEGSGTDLTGSDTAANGDAVLELRNWLAADLAANTKPFVFVFGHEPAFPENRHVGDSLDAHPANRDAFWQLLEDNGVHAYFVGHTHYYSDHQGDKDGNGDVWQIDAGAAGNGVDETYVDVAVTAADVTFTVYDNSGGSWHEVKQWSEPIPEPGSLTLLGLAALALLRRRR